MGPENLVRVWFDDCGLGAASFVDTSVAAVVADESGSKDEEEDAKSEDEETATVRNDPSCPTSTGSSISSIIGDSTTLSIQTSLLPIDPYAAA